MLIIITEVTVLTDMYRGMHPYSDTHKTLLKLGHSERTLYLQKGLIRGEQTQY